MMQDCSIDIAGEGVLLMPERALFWQRTDTLFIADTHFGKSSLFRAHGIALPAQDTRHDFERLTQAIRRVKATRLVILGDLLHAKKGVAAHVIDAGAAWREQHPELDVILIKGNHDRHAGEPPESWHMTCIAPPYHEAPFCYRHIPPENQSPDEFTLAGHLHPAVSLRLQARQQVKLPCFVIDAHQAILPAFGQFTDGGIVRRTRDISYYAVTESSVIALSR